MENWLERTQLLVGEDVIKIFSEFSVAVVGLGGVGAYAAEMLVRSGIGNILILDSDAVSITNKNRQLLALESTLGYQKSEVMAQRLKDINPQLNLTVIDEYLTPENVEELLSPHKIDFLVDAIDTLSPKLALISYCVNNKLPLISSMGAGAKFDATKIKIADISKSFNCPLAYIIRKKLRKMGISKGFKVVFSEELPQRDAIIEMEERNKKSQVGTISYLPAAFGLICAQGVIEYILKNCVSSQVE